MGLIGVLVVGFGLIYGSHWLLNPWVTVPGRPGLTGYWQGEVTVAPGDNRRVVLHLKGDPPNRCQNCPDIDGEAKVCGATQHTTYDVWGDPLNFRGTRFSLKIRPVREGPGRFLNRLDGEWDGDLIRADTEITVIDADGVARSTTSSDRPPDPPLRVELRRATAGDYRAAC
ncbi:hypothetical protein ONA91_17005 [Micromonospora sp. DR5-3]|uniref:hypothetical protein n=1 Tax=Micromonospora sp. DR5-3 TaxID=2992129 RepID=UPI002230B3D9|nr:hypothetical protein [Micromonospora sp. DR5-3]MCW3816144.1 hypothetical protein [Micromonospora sp. DR5-3]